VNSDLHFTQLCKDKETREWLEECLKRDLEVFMTVGVHTVRDARIISRTQASSHVGASAKVSVTAPATLGTLSIIPGTGSTFDAAIEGSAFDKNDSNLSFIAPDEQIIAVQYRKLKFKWFSSRSVDTAFLERGGRWKVRPIGIRESDSRNGVDDLVEVSLNDVSAEELRNIINVEGMEVVSMPSTDPEMEKLVFVMESQ